MRKRAIYTADDEEPDCGQCDNCDGNILDCSKFCGLEHDQRTDYADDKEN